MSLKPATFFASPFILAGLIVSPIAAQAGGTSHVGSYGGSVSHAAPPKTYCPQPAGGGKSTGIGTINVYKPISINNNIDVNKPTSINTDINVYKPVTVINNVNASKNIDINKPVTINKTIDNSKNININNNIDNSKNIIINKNIDINKPVTINKGGSGSKSSSQSEAEAEAAAVASAVAAAAASSNSSSILNFSGGNNSSTSSSSASSAGGSESSSSAFGFSGSGTAIGGSSYIAETPGPFAGGDLGTIAVEATPIAARAACTFQEATVIKAIHAVCVSADNHEFPASHMVPDTWIDASYEGEIARCIPGSHLKVTVGAVFQSNEGMASSWSHGQTLECAPHEAVRHFKDGMLKCAPAVAVPDCTERTNLRKYGTADMFFTYRTKVCLETHEEYAEVAAHESLAEGFKGSGNTSAP